MKFAKKISRLEAIQQDMEIEKQVNEFLGKEKLTEKAIRQFVVEVGGNNNENDSFSKGI